MSIKTYKLGDKVLVLKGSSKTTGTVGTITKIRPNPDTFDDSYVYYLDGEKTFYYYYEYLKLDISFVRNEKIISLLKKI